MFHAQNYYRDAISGTPTTLSPHKKYKCVHEQNKTEKEETDNWAGG